MKINGLTPVYFDIETTGFSAWEDEFVCAASSQVSDEIETFGVEFQQITTDFEETMTKFGEMREMFDLLLITYNGENYRGGFDFPWLRSKCIQQGVEWRLSGVKHLDLLPLVRKYLNTTGYVEETPSKSQFKAGDLKKLAKANDIDYQNMKQAYKAICELDNPDWLEYQEPEAKEDNSLQGVYQKLFDPEQEERYISGDRIPELYEFHKAESDPRPLETIKDHNRRDVERLKKVAEAVIPVLPDWEIERNIKEL